MSRPLTFQSVSALVALSVAPCLCPAQGQIATRRDARKNTALAHKAAGDALEKADATERAYYTVCMNRFATRGNISLVPRKE